MILYHITRTKNLPWILSKGLKPTTGGLGGIAEGEGHKKGIYFFKSLEEMSENLGFHWMDTENWTVLEVDVPSSFTWEAFDEVEPGEFGYFQSIRLDKKVPPDRIRILGSLSKWDTFLDWKEKTKRQGSL